MKNIIIGAGVVIVLAIGAYFIFKQTPSQSPVTVDSFEECAAQGYQIMESYPRQCKTTDGRNFTEDVGNAIEKQDLIVVSAPTPNSKITSPLTVSGQARGPWFFEASFPVILEDSQGNVIGTGIAEAQSDWMTDEFVPFEAILEFTSSAEKGKLILMKANASGLPENDDQLEIPVNLK